MAWGKNDFMAAGMIIIIISVAVIVGLYVSGNFNPSVNTVYPFR